MARVEAVHRDLGGLQIAPPSCGAAKERSIPQANDERSEEVRSGHGSDEPGEQRPFGVGGAGGAKGRTKRESGKPKLVPCTETVKRVTGG